ncbi:MAG: hypothetical protein ABI912_09810 [Actinomycetota bacterium]
MALTTKSAGFSADEKKAMRDRASELKAQASGSDGEADILAKIDEMPDEDGAMATSFHQLVRSVAPDLVPRTWYGMPAYATPGRDGKVVCFFQSAAKMKTRYNSIGFSDTARLDEGSMWSTSFALLTWNASNEKRLRAIVKKAVA